MSKLYLIMDHIPGAFTVLHKSILQHWELRVTLLCPEFMLPVTQETGSAHVFAALLSTFLPSTKTKIKTPSLSNP